MCTNNHVEGWHSRLKKVVGKVHPNIFEIVEAFKKEQASTEVLGTACCWSCTSTSPQESAPKGQDGR